MCGRFTLTVSKEQLQFYLRDNFEVESLKIDDVMVPSYNVTPSQSVVSLIYDGQGYRGGSLKWGFVPHFKTDKKLSLINARVESLHEKVSFREAAARRRCVVVADGYYEWDENKDPWFIDRGRALFLMAGVYNMDLNRIATMALITQESKNNVIDIHHRMPLLMDVPEAKKWLVDGLYDSSIASEFGGVRVSKRVNRPSENDSGLIVGVSSLSE